MRFPTSGSLSLLLLLSTSMLASLSRAADFTDALGRQLTLEETPERIVSLAPSITEILYFLGLGDRVVGVTEFSTHPPETARKPKVGSFVNLNVETIVALAPDLVIGTADGNLPADVELLERAGLPVFILNPRTIDQIIGTLIGIGELCGIREHAQTMALDLSSRIDAIAARTADLERPLVFLQVSLKPLMSANGSTYLDDLIHLAGGLNMTRNQPINYPRISLEEVIQRRPEVILVSSMARDGDFEAAKREWSRWTSIPAVRHGRVHLVDSDLVDRPSPRVVEALSLLARLIHPELDWDD